ncbi:MAG: M81 family metallopeptidase [Pseudomonadota bacterium]
MRIAIAGFQHETNTFAPGRAGLAEFRMADSWPGLLQGQRVVTDTAGMTLPIAGAIRAAAEAAEDVDILPILWCAAEPSGPVTDEAFNRIVGEILDALCSFDTLDGIYLDLHGAMVTERHLDGEGVLLRQMRREVGPALPIGISLDLHANVTETMVEAATLITIYRSYPHLDMAEAGARCMRRLLRWIAGTRFASAHRQGSFLVPLHAQGTGQAPCQALYQHLEESDDGRGAYAELAMGFTAADIPDCGPSVVAYGRDQSDADSLADSVIHALEAARDVFDTHLLTPSEAVREAQAARGQGPVILADVQDNPGAGGTADTTGVLHALLEQNAEGAVLGVLCDPETAAKAHSVGLGGAFQARLGAKSGLPGEVPVQAMARVESLSDGAIAYSGAMYGGGTAALGPSCLLALGALGTEVRVVVSTTRIQCLDRALFTHFSVDLEAARIVCVKSTVHFRADFEPIASRVLNVAAPGAFACKLSRSDYRRLRPGVACL